jgi:hypothetical protein
MFKTTAKITKITDIQTVGAKKSPKRDVIFEIDSSSNWPKMLAVTFWESTMGALAEMNEPDEAEIEFKVESREYNGKYYTNCNAVSIASLSKSIDPEAPAPEVPEHDPDDMPF